MKKNLFLSLVSILSVVTLVGCTETGQTSNQNSEPASEQEVKSSSDVKSNEEQPTSTEEVVSSDVQSSVEEPSSAPVSNLKPVIFDVPAEGFDTSKEVEVVFYTTMGDSLQKIFNTYLEDFNTLYPNIHVTLEPVGGYDDVRDQIKMELANGEHPNFAYCYPDHIALYNKAKAVYCLDSLIDSQIEVTRADGTKEILGLTEEQKADFIPGYYEEGRQFGNGYMYSLPFSKSTEVLYYNKTFFEANNISVPTSWAELFDVCTAIKNIDPTSIPLGYDSEANWFITMTEQLHSPYTTAVSDSVEGHFLFDNELNREFVESFKTMYDLGYITTQKLYGAYTSGLFVETGEANQKSYMSIGSSAGATHQRPAKGDDGNYPFEVGITSIPQINPDDAKVISQGPSICLFKDSDPQKVLATWLVMKYFTTDVAFQAEFSMQSGYVPVIKSVTENPVYKAFLDKADGSTNIAALSAKVCMEQESAYFTSPAFLGSSEARDRVGELLVAVFSGTKTIDVAFKEAIELCVANSK